MSRSPRKAVRIKRLSECSHEVFTQDSGRIVMIGRVFVTPKPELLDPQGQAIRQSLHALGYAEVADVRFGKYLEIEVTGADPEAVRKRLEEMCRRLLANEVIEEYRIEVAGHADGVERQGE